jgi:hypothetical protein
MQIGALRRVEVSQWICIIAGSRLIGGRFGAYLCLTYESTLTRARLRSARRAQSRGAQYPNGARPEGRKTQTAQGPEGAQGA